jgi:hypothetical protein
MRWGKDGQLPLMLRVCGAVMVDGVGESAACCLDAFSVCRVSSCPTLLTTACFRKQCTADSGLLRRFATFGGLKSSLRVVTVGPRTGVTSAIDFPVEKVGMSLGTVASDVASGMADFSGQRDCGAKSLTQVQLARSPPAVDL